MKNSWGLRRSLSTLELLPRVFSFLLITVPDNVIFTWIASEMIPRIFKPDFSPVYVQMSKWKTNGRLHLILDQVLHNSSTYFVLVCHPNVIIAGAVTTSEQQPCGGSLVVGWLWWFVWSVRISLHYFARSFLLLLVFWMANSHFVEWNSNQYIFTHDAVQASW